MSCSSPAWNGQDGQVCWMLLSSQSSRLAIDQIGCPEARKTCRKNLSITECAWEYIPFSSSPQMHLANLSVQESKRIYVIVIHCVSVRPSFVVAIWPVLFAPTQHIHSSEGEYIELHRLFTWNPVAAGFAKHKKTALHEELSSLGRGHRRVSWFMQALFKYITTEDKLIFKTQKKKHVNVIFTSNFNAVGKTVPNSRSALLPDDTPWDSLRIPTKQRLFAGTRTRAALAW